MKNEFTNNLIGCTVVVNMCRDLNNPIDVEEGYRMKGRPLGPGLTIWKHFCEQAVVRGAYLDAEKNPQLLLMDENGCLFDCYAEHVTVTREAEIL